MIFLHTLLLAVALASSMQEMLAEYRLQLKAYALYERRAYKEAEIIFRQLVTLEPEQQEKTVFSIGFLPSRRVCNSGTVFPKPLGYCSV